MMFAVTTFKCRGVFKHKNKLKEAFGAELYMRSGRPVTIEIFENFFW